MNLNPPSSYGDQFSDDIFRSSDKQTVKRFARANWEKYVQVVAVNNGLDPEGFIEFVQSALDSELQRLEDEDF